MLVAFSDAGRKNLLAFGFFCIILTGLTIYSNNLYAPFVFDDYSSIVDNETVKSLKNSTCDISNTRYVTGLSFALNYALSANNSFSYHLVNNLIHILNSLLVYYLVILIIRTPVLSNAGLSNRFIAFSSSMMFLVHPVQTEAVTYIAQRTTSLATLFYCLSLIMFLKARLSQQHLLHKKFFSAKQIFFLLFSLASGILAIKTKPIAFTLPVMIMLVEICFFRGTGDKKAVTSGWKKAFYFLPLIMVVLIIFSMINTSQPIGTILDNLDLKSRETLHISRADYLLTQFRVIPTYLRLLILPVNQSSDYSYRVYHSFLNIRVLLSFVFVLSIFFIAFFLFHASRYKLKALRVISFGIFWFFIALSVESSIIPIRDVIFEHRLYLPSIGFFIAIISSADIIIKKPKIKIAMVMILAILFSAGTYYRNFVWHDPQTLLEDVLRKFPDNVRAINGLGVINKNDGKYIIAIEQFEKILEINPEYPLAYYNIGDVYFQMKNYEKASEYFRKTLQLELGYYTRLDTLNSLAIAYSEMGKDDDAVRTFKKAVELYPKEIYPKSNLARQYIKMGKADLAIEILEEALKIRETSYLYYNLSTAYKLKGEKIKSEYFKQKASGFN